MFTLRHFLLALLALFLVPSTLGAALTPRASGTPCTYVCPTQDKNGRALGQQSTSGGNLKCTYGNSPATNCFYDPNDGTAKTGNAGTCATRATSSCTPSRREARNVYNAWQEQRRKRAANPTPTIPEHMKTRAAMKKRSQQEAKK